MFDYYFKREETTKINAGIPGPDRVVFVSESCIYAGAMTHDGAPADHPNWFVACT